MLGLFTSKTQYFKLLFKFFQDKKYSEELKAIELKSNSELRQFVTEWTYYGRAMKRKYDAINAAFESLNSSYEKVCKNIDDFAEKQDDGFFLF